MAVPNKFQIALHYDVTQYLSEKHIAFENGRIERANEMVLTVQFGGTQLYIFMDGAEFAGTTKRASFERRAFRNNVELASGVMDHLRLLI